MCRYASQLYADSIDSAAVTGLFLSDEQKDKSETPGYNLSGVEICVSSLPFPWMCGTNVGVVGMSGCVNVCCVAVGGKSGGFIHV